MADAPTPAAPTNGASQPTTQTPAPVAKPGEQSAVIADAKPVVDPKAEKKQQVNQLLKELGYKVKAKDRELDPDVDAVFGFANRGYGATQLVEEAKAEKAKAAEILKLKEQLDGDDPEAALAALQKLGGRHTEQLAMRIAREKFQRAQEEEQLSERERYFKQQAEQQQAELRRYKEIEAQRAREAEEQNYKKEFTSLQAELLQQAVGIAKALRMTEAQAPSILPRIARHMRAAKAAGVDVLPEQIAAEVQAEVDGEWQERTNAMSPEQRYDFHGPEYVKSLIREHMKRVKQVAPTPEQAQRVNGTSQKQQQAPADVKRGTPGFFR